MNTTRRPQNLTERKTRVWTSGVLTMGMTALGVPGQIGVNTMGARFRSKTGREFLASDTLAHTWLKGLWNLNIAGTTTVRTTLQLGVGFYASGIDNGDFPNMNLHDGDWQLHDIRSGREPVLAQDVYHPDVGIGTILIESAGQRSVPRGVGYDLFAVGQIDGGLSGGTSTVSVGFTQLWLTKG